MNVRDAWELLGLAPTDEAREVKCAYARLLKTIDADADPAAFIRLRDAYELALSWGSSIPDWESDETNEQWQSGADMDGAASDGFLDSDLPFDMPALEGSWPLWSGDRGVWRPPSPSALGGRLGELAGEIERLLFEENGPDAERIAASGVELLAAIDHAHVDEAREVEAWLASAIIGSIPRSDPLVRPAIRRFGWGEGLLRWRDNFDIEEVLQRRDDMAFAVGARLAAHPQHRAFAELCGPPRERLGAFELGLAQDVRDLLRIVRESHPTLERDFDPAGLAWWRDYFERPHLPAFFWVIVLGGTPFLTFGLALFWATTRRDNAPIPLLLAASAVLLVALCFGWSRIAPIVRKRREDAQWARPEAGRQLWVLAAAALLLPPLAGAARFGEWAAILWLVVSLAVAGGLSLDAPRPAFDGPEATGGHRNFAGIAIAFIAIGILIGVPGEAALYLAAPFATLAYAAATCHPAAEMGFATVSKARLLAALGAIAAASIAIIAAVFVSAPGLPPPFLIALAPVALAAQHLATASTLIVTAWLDWPIRVGCLLFYFGSRATLYEGDGARALAAAVALYALLYTVARIVIVAKELRRGPSGAAN